MHFLFYLSLETVLDQMFLLWPILLIILQLINWKLYIVRNCKIIKFEFSIIDSITVYLECPCLNFASVHNLHEIYNFGFKSVLVDRSYWKYSPNNSLPFYFTHLLERTCTNCNIDISPFPFEGTLITWLGLQNSFL